MMSHPTAVFIYFHLIARIVNGKRLNFLTMSLSHHAITIQKRCRVFTIEARCSLLCTVKGGDGGVHPLDFEMSLNSNNVQEDVLKSMRPELILTNAD